MKISSTFEDLSHLQPTFMQLLSAIRRKYRGIERSKKHGEKRMPARKTLARQRLGRRAKIEEGDAPK